MITEPLVRPLQAQQTAVIHLTLPRAQLDAAITAAAAELLAVLNRQGIAPAGALYAWHWQPPTDAFDFEIGFPVNTPVQAEGRVKPGQLPEGQVASVRFHGDYAGLPAAWRQFCAMLATRGLTCAPASWEVFHSAPRSAGGFGDRFETELFKPLA